MSCAKCFGKGFVEVFDHSIRVTCDECDGTGSDGTLEVGRLDVAKTQIPWPEMVAMLSINPDAASSADVAQLASELMGMRTAMHRIYELSLGDHDAYRIAQKALDAPPHPTHHVK